VKAVGIRGVYLKRRVYIFRKRHQRSAGSRRGARFMITQCAISLRWGRSATLNSDPKNLKKEGSRTCSLEVFNSRVHQHRLCRNALRIDKSRAVVITHGTFNPFSSQDPPRGAGRNRDIVINLGISRNAAAFSARRLLND